MRLILNGHREALARELKQLLLDLEEGKPSLILDLDPQGECDEIELTVDDREFTPENKLYAETD